MDRVKLHHQCKSRDQIACPPNPANSALQSLFADATFSKPYFVTYINTAFFSLALIPFYLKRVCHDNPRFRSFIRRFRLTAKSEEEEEIDHMSQSTEALLRGHSATRPHEYGGSDLLQPGHAISLDGDDEIIHDSLDARATLRLASRFCCFWFAANYANSASFSHTSVASSIILASTSSVFTLILGSFLGVEKFNVKKLLGVFASLGGVTLITLLDAKTDRQSPDSGDFPYKSSGEIALGNAFAMCSAVLYGVYATTFTKAVGDESRVNMPLFFGFVGLTSTLCLWPGLFLLHSIGLESFQLPPTGHIWGALLVNGFVSMISDIAWAYAVLMTSPLVVTVGISLTIPLSLVGQMFINSQYVSFWYWMGAAVVVAAFVLINHESKATEEPQHAIEVG